MARAAPVKDPVFLSLATLGISVMRRGTGGLKQEFRMSHLCLQVVRSSKKKQ